MSDVQGAVDYINWMRTIEQVESAYYDDLGRLLAYLSDEPTPASWRVGVLPPVRPGYHP